ncbi:MAG: choice-of-anchor Q domain-containing protein [Roseibacillus sp.]
MKSLVSFLAVASLTATLAFAGLPLPTNIMVTNTDDSGVGSLQQAIFDSVPDGSITFDPAVFNTEANKTITLTSGQLVLSGKELTIDASCVCGITLDGNDNSRLFSLQSSATLTLNAFNLTRGNAIDGAAIHVDSGCTLTLTNSALYNNATPDDGGNSGGGLYNAGTATVENCTFYRNFAWLGGAIQTNFGGETTLRHCTIVDNSSTDIAGGVTNGGTLTMENTVLAHNVNNAGGNPNLASSGPFTSLGGNFVRDNTGEASKFPLSPFGTTNANGDYAGTAAQLLNPGFITSGEAFGTTGYLTNHGGPTLTLMPLPNSPLIDKAKPTTTPTPDQRGVATLALRDIGAVETTWDQFLTITSPGTTLDITVPTDSIITFPAGNPISFTIPASYAIDNTNADVVLPNEVNSGFTISPALGSTQVLGLSIQSGPFSADLNGAPSSFILLGSSDLNHFTPLTAGPIPPFTGQSQTQTIYFTHYLPTYVHYRLIFPQNHFDNDLTIGEIQLLGVPAGIPCLTDVTLAHDPNGESDIIIEAQVRPDRSYKVLAGDSPDNLVEDGNFSPDLSNVEPFASTYVQTFNSSQTVPQKQFFRLQEQTTWQATTADSTPNVGQFTSLAFSPAGLPAISHFDNFDPGLKFAAFDGTSWQNTTVDSTGSYTSLAFSPAGLPAISYTDETNFSNAALKFASFDGSSWQTETVDSSGNVGWDTSLAFSPAGLPAISYRDSTNEDLKFASFNGSSWQIETVDSSSNVGLDTSLAFSPAGLPAISYYDVTNEDLKFATFDGSSWQTETVDSSGNVGRWPSLAFSLAGLPAISYYDVTNEDLKFASFDGSSWQPVTVDSLGNVGWYTSLAFSPTGLPSISYTDVSSTNLKYASFDGSSWQPTTIDSTGNVGLDTSLAFSPAGLPAISYLDLTNINGVLKYIELTP